MMLIQHKADKIKLDLDNDINESVNIHTHRKPL